MVSLCEIVIPAKAGIRFFFLPQAELH